MVNEMHYHENTLFDLDPKVKVTQNDAQNVNLLHPMVKEKMHL